MQQFLINKAIISAMLGWFVGQTIKVCVGIIREKRFNFKWFVETGGMPSAHAAGVSALSTAVGLQVGFNSVLFAVAVIFAFITMFDAQGVRRSAGQQAELLNKIVEDIYAHREVTEDKIKELLGHTPVQVFAGALLGVIIAWMVCL